MSGFASYSLLAQDFTGGGGGGSPNAIYSNIFGVQDLVELAAIGAPIADKSGAFVEDEGAWYFFDAQSIVAPTTPNPPTPGDDVVKPDYVTLPDPGRWYVSLSGPPPPHSHPFADITGTLTDTQHGNRSGGSLHALATTLLAGFMSAADKTKLDGAAQTVLMWGNSNVNASTTTRYLTPGYTDNAAQTSVVQFRSPVAGVLRNLYVRHNTTAGNGNAIVYTVRVNGVATALLVSLASTSTDGNDQVDTVSVAKGDLIDIEVTKTVGVGSSPSDVCAALEVRAA